MGLLINFNNFNPIIIREKWVIFTYKKNFYLGFLSFKLPNNIFIPDDVIINLKNVQKLIVTFHL